MQPPKIVAVLSLLVFLATLSPLRAGEAGLFADVLRLDAATQVWKADGHARLETEQFILEAGSIEYDAATQRACAQGDVVLRMRYCRLVAERICVWLKTKELEADTVVVSRLPFFVHAKKAQGTLDALLLSDVELFVDEPGGIRPSARMQQVILSAGPVPRMKALKAQLRLGPVPVFYLPRFQTQLDRFPFELQTRAEYTRAFGVAAKMSLLLPLISNDSGHVKGGPVVDVYSRRGVLVGPKVQYVLDDEAHEGSLEGGYLSDRAYDRGTDFFEKDIPQKRGFLYWKHQSHPNERWSVVGRLTALSDEEIERNARYTFFEEDPLGGSALEANYRAQSYQGSVFLKKRLNSFQHEVEHLPQLRVDWMPQPLGDTGVFAKGFVSASEVVKVRPYDDDFLRKSISSKRAQAATVFELPIPLGAAGTLSPQVGIHATHYQKTPLFEKNVERALAECGIDWRACVYGDWDAHNPLLRIDGLRHRIEPSIAYRKHMALNTPGGPIPDIERGVFNPNLPTLDLLRRRDIDSLSPGSVLRLGLENTLQTRDPDYGSRDLAKLRIYHDRQLDQYEEVWQARIPRPKEHPSYVLASLTPLPFLAAEVFGRWRSRHFEELHTRLKVFSAETWEVSLGAHHLNSRIEQYALLFSYRFSENYRGQTELRFDAHTRRFLHHGYRLYARLSQSWDLGLSLDCYPSASEKDGRVRLSFKLCTIGF